MRDEKGTESLQQKFARIGVRMVESHVLRDGTAGRRADKLALVAEERARRLSAEASADQQQPGQEEQGGNDDCR